MRFLAYLVMTPVAAVILVIAYANREWVTIGLDPTGYTGLKPIAAPQYAALLASMAIGVVAGGVSSWLGQAWRRRALREAEIENRRLRGELQAAREAGAPRSGEVGLMRFLDAAAIDAALDFPALIAALDAAFLGGLSAPERHHHVVPVEGGPPATHLLMPAWGLGSLGVKIVNVFPGNGARGLPAVQGVYVLQSGETGETVAVLDGTRLTLWRTSAASALAASRLARADARRLALIGAGALAPFLARAHASVRPIREIAVWNHRPEGARKLAAALAAEGFAARAEEDLERAVKGADLVSAATLSTTPLIRGAWLQPGQHVDLVGAFNMTMREADDLALQRARVFVDTSVALHEGGDVAQAIRDGALAKSAVIGDLAALARGAPGRGADEEITLFKAVGASVEDLAAARLVWSRQAARA